MKVRDYMQTKSHTKMSRKYLKNYDIDVFDCEIIYINPNNIKYICPYNYDRINKGRVIDINSDWHINKVPIDNLMFCKSKDFSDLDRDLYDAYTEKNYKELYDSMKSDGYINTGSFPTIVARDDIGELYFIDGQHRLVISKLLGIKKIPVVVLFNHPAYNNED